MSIIPPVTNAHDEQKLVLKNLDASSIELTGIHLIEASAGTGKTYNITRIYLRLLLERELTVEQILLMTFTKDATQELRGRIDASIREALSDWHRLCEDDSFFASLDKRVEANHREFLLKRALLFLDEAAIFTIHGFCQRVLSQHAFSSGLPFNANMAASSAEITLQVCQDWYRRLAKSDVESFMLVSSFWATPDSFLSSFSKAIGHTSQLSVVDAQHIAGEFIALVRNAQQSLLSNTELFDNALILVKKGAEQEKRRAELASLLAWLNGIVNQEFSLIDIGQGNPKMPDAFFDGKRYGKSVFKVELLEAFNSIKQVKEQVKKIATQLNKAKAYSLVQSAIYTIREQVIIQKQALNILDFDDLINTLADCLQSERKLVDEEASLYQSINDEGSPNKPLLAEQLLLQYPVALIDEFQDTDPKQFGILQAIYYAANAKKAKAGLFLIGDPKQAIYGFRGGDIFAYLNARHGCDYHWLMDTNWRSTPDMVNGYNQVFIDKAVHGDKNSSPVNEDNQNNQGVFGYGIPYLPVHAGKKSSPSGIGSTDSSLIDSLNGSLDGTLVSALDSNDSNKALQFIHFSDNENPEEKVSQASRPILANWCANEITYLLGAQLSDSKNSQTNNSDMYTSVKPSDIAILVRDGAEARDMKQALHQAGLDCVFLSDRANLFHSPQAKQLLCLLKGILQPENERLFVAALSCGLLGFDANKLYVLQQDEIAYQTLKFAFIDYRTQWQRHGFITMAMSLMHQHIVVFPEDKDRCLTNILHLFEILQVSSMRLDQGQALLHWFEQQCHLDTNEVEAELRLESDGDLIRLITQHGSKGLEYPVVFIPFACRHKDPLKFGTKSVSYLEYHNAQGELCLSLDGSKEAKKAMSDEAYAESIRLLYVAITRAERRCYILTCAFDNYHLSPLGKTLKIAEKDDIAKHLQHLKIAQEQSIGLREVALTYQQSEAPITTTPNNTAGHVNKQQVEPQPEQYGVSIFTGNIERNWWLSSFSALSRNIRHAGVSNPDRDVETLGVLQADETLSEQLCFTLAKGAHTGNLLHDILENTDFCDPNWSESLEKPLQKYGELHNQASASISNKLVQEKENEQALIQWLTQVINTRFIVSHGKEEQGSLSDLPQEKTLRESEFYFPMEGKGTDALANLLTDHRNSAKRSDNATLKFPVVLPGYKKLSGMMHGFIDLIFEYEGKYYLSDYKSSHLGDNYQAYNFTAMLDNVEKNYYDLQYLIYSLALHRYLRQTLADYDVNQHFGGVYYLYIRGMTTDPKQQNSGVYYRHITEQEINDLDTLFSAQISNQQLPEGEV